MKKYFKRTSYWFLVLITLIVFKSWFIPGLITGGDFWPYSRAVYETKPLLLFAWDSNNFVGFGGNVNPFLWMHLNFGIPITILGKWFNLDWNIIERVYYLFPFLGLTLFSSAFLFRELISKKKFYIFASSIFLFNTYILMVTGGGQLPGIGIAYALFPLVLYSFIKILNLDKFEVKIVKYSLVTSLLLSLQLLFDIRIAYIALIAVLVYWLLKVTENKNIKYLYTSFIFVFLIPALLSILIHSFWIIPTIVRYQNPVEQLGFAYSSLDAVKFFSFAKFENAISLLHPNWPENIFGKTGFLKQEFLFLPILAFLSLLFINKKSKEKIYIIFFALLALLGAFLAKGANEPFGGIYLWMFNHVPGFIMFRDPSKWYTLVAVSYSILIPFSVWKIYEYLLTRHKKIKYAPQVFLIVVIVLFLFLIKPALFGQLSGTFKTAQIPQDYIKLEKFISSQNNFSRTLWIPTLQRFGFYSNNHPAIPAQDLFKTANSKDLIKNLYKENAQVNLQESSVKYVIVPYDSQGEIFLKDRKYNENAYLLTIKDLKSISWLKQIQGFGKIAVFEAPNPKDHFYISNQPSAISNQRITYKYVSPVEYEVLVRDAKKGEVIVFSENYDAGWVIKSSKFKVQSLKFNNQFNSFVLPMDGNYSFEVYYTPQVLVNAGTDFSLVTIIVVLGTLFYLKKKK